MSNLTFATTSLLNDLKSTSIKTPIERVLASNGNWYNNVSNLNGNSKLIIGYKGEYTIDGNFTSEKPIKFNIKDKSIIKSIYFPYVNEAETSVTFTIKDLSGNILGPFNLVKTITNHNKYLINNKTIDYVFIPKQEIVLDKGEYILELSNPKWLVTNNETGLEGAFLIKGVNFNGEYRHLNKLAKENSDKKLEKKPIETSDKFSEKNKEKYNTSDLENPANKKEPFFRLEEDTMIMDITINTIHNGNGAIPDIISILSSNKTVIASFQAVGGTLNDVPNGVWQVYPRLILPKGDYYLKVPDPNIIGYTKEGDPEFYIQTAIPVYEKTDFSGTYSLDFDAFKVKTLYGEILNPVSSIHLVETKIAVIDNDEYIEIIGKYEGIPFSQKCEITYRDDTHIEAKFAFGMNLKNLPYKASVSANGKIVIGFTNDNELNLMLDGEGFYNKDGGDSNEYDLVGIGSILTNDLPGYVMAAISSSNSVGSIPGPDNSTQAATGLLFPPLVGLVANSLTKLLKLKGKNRKEMKSGEEHNLGWYRKKYPKASDETIAMIMLGDAMANTDNPDDDPESMSDAISDSSSSEVEPDNLNEDSSSSSENTSSDNDEYEEIYDNGSYEEKEEIKLPENNIENTTEQNNFEPEQKQTIELETGPHGRKSLYELDKETGEYINPETGGALDMEAYEKIVKPSREINEDFNDRERAINAASNTKHDRETREFMAEQKRTIKKEKYMKALSKKYHVTDEAELEKIIEERSDYYGKRADSWNRMGDIMEVAEKSAMVIQTGADAFIDGAANVTGPAGKAIRASYKFTKNVAGTVADKGMNTNSLTAGVIKGTADAAGDFIKSDIVKSGISIAAESVSSGLTDEKGFVHGLKDGFVTGTYKATSGVILGKIGGGGYDNSKVMKLTANSAGQWVSKTIASRNLSRVVSGQILQQARQTTTKIAGAVIDEFATKPITTVMKGDI
jgi:hypothetical protein